MVISWLWCYHRLSWLWLVLVAMVRTWGCCVAMVISLRVNHQCESIAVSARAICSSINLRVSPAQWIEVDLEENYVDFLFYISRLGFLPQDLYWRRCPCPFPQRFWGDSWSDLGNCPSLWKRPCHRSPRTGWWSPRCQRGLQKHTSHSQNVERSSALASRAIFLRH